MRRDKSLWILIFSAAIFSSGCATDGRASISFINVSNLLEKREDFDGQIVRVRAYVEVDSIVHNAWQRPGANPVTGCLTLRGLQGQAYRGWHYIEGVFRADVTPSDEVDFGGCHIAGIEVSSITPAR